MWYYTTPDATQHPLGVRDPDDRAGAERAARELLDRLAAEVTGRLAGQADSPPDRGRTGGGQPTGQTVEAAATAYLAAQERKVKAGKIEPGTLVTYRRQIGHLVRAFGARPVGSLDPDELAEWADRPGWSASYQSVTLAVVGSMLKHARVSLSLKRPHRESRGADSVISDEQFAKVISAARGKPFLQGGRRGDLAELLQALRETGARPQEVAQLTCEAVDWDQQHARLKKHKTRRKTGRDRVLWFSSAAMAILARQRVKYGTGFLFRTRNGRPYSREQLVRRMLEISERVGFRVIAYGLGRHSWATKALAAGVPDAVVAELLGHRGTGMLHHHYSHLGDQARLLRDAAERVSRGA